MKKYDVVIPLGQNCVNAYALRDCGIRKAAYPFDWSDADEALAGNCGFIGKIKMICNDFDGAFELQDLKETWWPDRPPHRAVINKKTGVHYVHAFEWDESVEKQYDSFYEKQTRRAKRLISDIENGNHILFVFSTIHEKTLSLKEINQGLKLLNQKFLNKDIDLLIIQNSIDCEPSEAKRIYVDEHIVYYLYKHIISGAGGNKPVLKRIFSEFIKGEVEYNFATDNIKNYGLSIRESWGRWSDGNDVYMSIPVNFDSDIIVDFNLWPYVVEQHTTQDVDVFLDDKKIASWHFEFGQSMPQTKLNISANEVKAGHITLCFKIKNPVSLRELDLGQNDRKLGIGFRTVKITAVQQDQD